MRNELQDILTRTAPTLLQDALGAVSLCVTFLAVFSISGLF